MLEEFFMPVLQENRNLLLEKTVLQEDGAPPHFADGAPPHCADGAPPHFTGSVNLLSNETYLNIGLVI
jgi:hypothetical protein